MTFRSIAAAALLLALAGPAFSMHILLTNDDGLTSNIKALYDALKAEGHDVIVSVPCTNQSGRGGALVMYSSNLITAVNDSQVTNEGGCHNGAATTGDPAVGPLKRTGYTNGDFYYVHGTPVMATMYGLDVLAQERWGKHPHVVLSGPNEGQNTGRIVNSSGTIGNAQFASAKGIPAIALSAGFDTIDNTSLADPDSAIVAQLTVKLLKELEAQAGDKRLLPRGISLNVNFPAAVALDSAWVPTRIGSFDRYNLTFNNTPGKYGFGGTLNDPSTATASQADNESVVVFAGNKISVTPMQVSFDQRVGKQDQVRDLLDALFQ